MFKRDVLLSLDFVRLATLFTEEDVKVYFIDNDVVMETGNIVIYGSQMQDIETYPVEALQGLIQQEYSSKCVVKKALLLAALDRLNIFVTEYEKNGVTLHFTKDGLELYSKKQKNFCRMMKVKITRISVVCLNFLNLKNKLLLFVKM